MLFDVLTLITTVGWLITYVFIIYRGFKDKTCGMPLPALALNITWEFTFSFLHPNPIPFQLVGNFAWFFLDVLILYTHFKYGRKEFSKLASPKWFVPWTLTALGVGFTVQYFVALDFQNGLMENYCALIINLIMSVAFIDMLARRKNVEGQSLPAAIGKCVGTLAANVMCYLDWRHKVLLPLAVAMFVFDVIYIVMLHAKLREQRPSFTLSADLSPTP